MADCGNQVLPLQHLALFLNLKQCVPLVDLLRREQVMELVDIQDGFRTGSQGQLQDCPPSPVPSEFFTSSSTSPAVHPMCFSAAV